MRTKHAYKSEKDRQALIDLGVSQNLYLIEDAITFKGNYLIFDTEAPGTIPLPEHIRVKNKVNELIDRIKEKIPNIIIDKL
jgi:hypothetical protein